MENVAVTGAGGFVGRNLTPYLESRGYRIIPVSLRNPGWKAAFPGEARAVIHLAGLAHDLKGAYRAEDYRAVNAGLTAEVFAAFRASRIRKFVFLSSVKAVADNPGGSALDEGAEPSPDTPFGKSKLEAERAILSADAGGRPVYVLRPCMIHGPGNKGNLNLLHRLAATGLPWPLAAFENARSFLSVDNLNFILGELLDRDIPPGIYHAADGEPLSTLQVMEILNGVAGRKTRAWRIPRGVVLGFAKIAGLGGLNPVEKLLYKLIENYEVSNRKLVAALGRELPVSARDGLLKTIHSFAR